MVHVKVVWKITSGGGATWTKQDTLKLIEVWGQETIQEQLQSCKRNHSIFVAVAREMRVAGSNRPTTKAGTRLKS